MKIQSLLATALLLTAALAAAPAAHATHIDCDPGSLPPATCQAILTAAHPVETTLCLLTTGLLFWFKECFPPDGV